MNLNEILRVTFLSLLVLLINSAIFYNYGVYVCNKKDYSSITIENLQKANRFNEYRANRNDNLYKEVVKELKDLKERNKAINETNKYLLKEYIKVIRNGK